MKKYSIYLDDLCQDILHEMKKIKYGDRHNEVMIKGENKDAAIETIIERLRPFVKDNMIEEEPE